MVVEASSLMSPGVQKSLLLKGRPGCNSLDFKSKVGCDSSILCSPEKVGRAAN